MPPEETVGVVLAGGGARGAYEIGVLSELLPELDRRGERPNLIVGTSIGALNAAYLAATAHERINLLMPRAESIWREISPRRIWRPPLAPRVARQLAEYGAHVWGSRRRPWGVLDSAPVAKTIAEIVPFSQLHANVEAQRVRAAVIATAALTNETVVFHAGGETPARDRRRAITYRSTVLCADHVRASAAIPALFPAAQIESPADARGWYFDGGVRLNTPIKPAIALGARRILVIGLNSIASGRAPRDDGRPDIVDGITQIMQATLADPLANDIRTLARENRIAAQAERRGVGLADRRIIHYAFVTPQEPEAIGRIAQEEYEKGFSSRWRFLRGDELSVLGRLVGADEDPLHGELLSYLFFAGGFTDRLIQLGKEDGRRWLATAHEDGPWRIEQDPPA